QHTMANIHELAERWQVAILNGLNAAQGQRVDLVENALVELLVLEPGFAHAAYGFGRQALVARHADDGRDRLADVQRLDERRIAGPEDERLAVARERIVEPARAAVRDFLRLERERIDLIVAQAELEVLVERADDRDGHRGRAAQAHAARHLGEYLDLHCASREPELVEHDAGRPLERA